MQKIWNSCFCCWNNFNLYNPVNWRTPIFGYHLEIHYLYLLCLNFVLWQTSRIPLHTGVHLAVDALHKVGYAMLITLQFLIPCLFTFCSVLLIVPLSKLCKINTNKFKVYYLTTYYTSWYQKPEDHNLHFGDFKLLKLKVTLILIYMSFNLNRL